MKNTKLPPFDPDLRIPLNCPSNRERSEQAYRLLLQLGQPDEETLVDLLTNLRHWLHESGYDPIGTMDTAARESREHFLIECGAKEDRFFTSRAR